MKAYELVPEAYHQKFRNYHNQESQTHVEFAHEKDVYFDRWCNSREVDTDFEKLRQAILVEEFKRFVHDGIKTYLGEQKIENLAKAAAYADDYALTHKSTFNKSRSFGSTKKSEVGKKYENVAPKKSSDKGQTSNQSMSKDRKHRSFAPVCHYCKKPGHVMSDCWLLKKRREEATPNAFVSSKSNWHSNPNRAESSIGFDKSEIIREEFKPFVSEGFVSLESSSSLVSIKILRDTGATQSLLPEGVLPLGVSTSTGESVITQGIEGGCVNVPLHKVNLVSDLVTGSVVVGTTRPTLPTKGVSLLLGNDLAGGKMVADPKVTSKPVTLVSTEELEEVIPSIFPSCAVTQAMAKKAQEEPKDCKQSTDVLVDLSDTFLNNYDPDMQNSNDTNPKARVDSEKQDTIDGPDV